VNFNQFLYQWKLLLEKMPVMDNMFKFFLTLIALTCVFGCGGADENAFQRAAVTGVVKLNGQPLSMGVISFIPSESTKGPKVSASIHGGQFKLPVEFGPLVGTHRVKIESMDNAGLAIDDEATMQRFEKKRKKLRVKVVRVPAIYNDRSNLVVHITENELNEFKFDLSSKQK